MKDSSNGTDMDISLGVRTLFVEGNDPVQGTQRINREKALGRLGHVVDIRYEPPPAKAGYKWCSNCNEQQRLEAFSPHPYTKDRRHSWCKSCRAEQARRWRAMARKATA